jgi:ubiquitin-like protein Pup
MARQERIQKTSTTSAPQEGTPVVPNLHARADHEITDELLDEIDSVLETNAEEFVAGYIQKGGQ